MATNTLTGTRELARHIQHTLVTAECTEADIVAHAEACAEHGFDAAMVAAPWVETAVRALQGTGVQVASAVAFPMGMVTTRGKVAEAVSLVERGAAQLDIGVSVGVLRSGDHRRFRDDIAAVVAAVAPAPVKVMLELPLLTPEQRDQAVDAAVDAGVAYVKNASSGAVGRATPEDIAYLRERAPSSVKVKASGGIKTAEQVRALIDAGADLVGTSSSVSIVTGEAGGDTTGGY